MYTHSPSLARSLILALVVTLGGAGTSWAAQTVPPSDVQRLVDDPAGVARVGERVVDLSQLKEFYRTHGYRLAWNDDSSRQVQAEMQAMAQTEGLSPESYGVPNSGSPLERDILTSDALARFGRDLATGRVSPTRLVGGMGPDTRPDFDSAAFLSAVSTAKSAVASSAPLPPAFAGYHRLKRALERYRSLAKAGGWPFVPDGPSLRPGQDDDRVPALRKRLVVTGELEARFDKGKTYDSHVVDAVKLFQARQGLDSDGTLGKATLAELNVSADDRVKQILVNLERWRWMPRHLDSTHIAVNLPAAHLELVRDGEIQMAMRVVVGEVQHQTPTMRTTMTSVVLNPTWTVPPSIATREMLPKLRKDPLYLASNNMQILEAFPDGSPESQGLGIDWHKYSKFPWRIRQAPGPDNALGQIKFNLSNQDDIYLHDTPKRQYFGRIFRALSHGCVRLERPVALAQALVPADWAPRVEELIAGNTTKTLRLEHPLTVYLMYMTAWADEDGTIHFRDDLYGHDGRLKAALKRPRVPTPAPKVAQDQQPGTL